MVLNMDRNVERYSNIASQLGKSGADYVRIAAVDGFAIEGDVDARRMLTPRPHLMQRRFFCLDSGDVWVYDGSIATSFPHLHLHGHHGTKGLTLSNIKALTLASVLSHAFRWFCILEDDAEVDENVYHAITDTCKKTSNEECELILMDNRSDGWGGTSAVCYSAHVVAKCKEDLHPLSDFSINVHEKEASSNLWDWKLWKYVRYVARNVQRVPIVPSGRFPSTIDVS